MRKQRIENKGPTGLLVWLRNKKKDTWHFHPACTYYQQIEGKESTLAVERIGRPPSGELCNQCLVKERRDQNPE